MENWLSTEPGLSSVDIVQIRSGQRDDNRRGGEETEGKGRNRAAVEGYTSTQNSLFFALPVINKVFARFCFGVNMAISVNVWVNYVECKVTLSRRSENAVAIDRVLKFLFDVETQHIDAVVQVSMRSMSYCKGTLQALHVAICFVCMCMCSKLRLDKHFTRVY